MTTNLEETLARELNQIAEQVDVPPMPRIVPAETSRSIRRWQPLLVAAAVILIVGVLAFALSQRGGARPQPAPPNPTIDGPTTTDAEPPGPPDGAVSVSLPTIPYLFDQSLYVDGAAVPGEWAFLDSRGQVWLAQRTDGSWWWGRPGVEPAEIDAEIDQPPVLSPGGGYIALIDLTGGQAHLTGFDTQPAGEGFGDAPIDLPAREGGVPLAVRAVTDEGDVIVQGTKTSLMWRAMFEDQQTVVNLSETAPQIVVLQDTPAGFVVVDGSTGAVDATSTTPHLATISDDGVVTIGDALPTYDDLTISPGGSWFVRSPAGTLGGEVTAVTTLTAQQIGSDDETVLDAPQDWGFANGSWTWEDDESLISTLLPLDASGPGEARLVRCDVLLGRCRAFDGPAPGDTAGDFSARRTLDEVVRAAVADDRSSLLDPAVIGDGEWNLLRDYAAVGSGTASTCRDNGSGTMDCSIVFYADDQTEYYAILAPASNAYGWQVTYVGIGGA